MGWYSSAWKDKHGRFADTPGLQLDVIDGPLAGRTVHVRDLECALWVAIVNRRQIVTASRDRPALPGHGELLGHYVADVDPRAPGMYWRPIHGRRYITVPVDAQSPPSE